MLSTDTLEHYGVRGMKWGVRRAVNPRTGRVQWPAPKPKRTPSKNEGTRKEYRSISNQELQARINRLNLERQYSQLLTERELQTNWKKRALHIVAKNAGLTVESEGKRLGTTVVRNVTNPLNKAVRLK